MPGTYTCCVKNSQTLQNCQSVTLVNGSNMVNFGTLREGDANNDNCVLQVDFSTLVSTFGRCAGNAGFDERADFDGSGCVVLVDFSLLATNFSQCGAIAPEPPPPAAWALARAPHAMRRRPATDFNPFQLPATHHAAHAPTESWARHYPEDSPAE